MLVATVIMAILAYYCSGVVELNSYKDMIDLRLDMVASRIKDDQEERDSLTDEIFSDCEEKARMVAMLVSQNARELSYELSLEEVRVISTAEDVTISNATGEVEYSTSTYSQGETINDSFIDHVEDTGYTQSIIDASGDIITATTRLDSTGLVLVTFSSDSMRKMLKSTDISTVTSEYPLFKNGYTAIIDTVSYTYLSHTDVSLVGTPSQLPQGSFNLDKDRGGFFCYVSGSKCYVRYSIYEDDILVGVLPTKEIYHLRSSVTSWVVFSALVLMLVGVLSVRFKRLKDIPKANNS